MKYRYMAGATAARMGDEMSGPALLLAAFTVTRSAAAGSALLAGLTISAAAGGPLFGAALDRSARPQRVLAGALTVYAAGLVVIQFALGRLPLSLVVCIAVVTGLSGPAVAGGGTSQLPRVVRPDELARCSALDSLTFTLASLTGPALAAVIVAWPGPRPAVAVSAVLVALAVPAAWSLASAPIALPAPSAPVAAEPPTPSGLPTPSAPTAPAPSGDATGGPLPLRRQLAEGFAIIGKRRALLRTTLTSVISMMGSGVLLVCCPLLGQQRLGAASRGALLISATAVVSLAANSLLARRPPRKPDTLVLTSTLVLCLSTAAAVITPGWLTMAAIAAGGAGEGPQLTGLLAVRHRESPARLRGQVFTTAVSVKIAGLAAGTALGGLLVSRSVTICLLAASALQLAAAATYLATRVPPARRAVLAGKLPGTELSGQDLRQVRPRAVRQTKH